MKGKPWDIEEERRLRLLFEEGRTVDDIAKTMVKTRDAVLSKIYVLGLKREEEAKADVRRLSSSSFLKDVYSRLIGKKKKGRLHGDSAIFQRARTR